jgi:hypothetical protein
VHFNQLCTHGRCVGYWAIRVHAGEFGAGAGAVPLAGLRAVVAFDTPQQMISGGWTEVLLIDQTATGAQRGAMESILGGQAGGPWEVLARFVERRLETRVLPIEFIEEPAGDAPGRAETTRSISIAGVLRSTIARIRGRDRSRPVMFDNIFNQIHAPRQTLCTGSTEYDDGVIRIGTAKTHALMSDFEWSGGRA